MGQQHSSQRPRNSNNTGTPPYNAVVQNPETRSQHANPRKGHRILPTFKSHFSAKNSPSNPPVPQDPPPRYRQTPEITYVLRVAKYLDPVSRMSLKYTNQYLYHGLEYTIASELWHPKPRPQPTLGPNSQVDDSVPGEAASQKRTTVDPARERRLRLLRLLVKDGLFGDGKSICAPCLSVHEDSLFLPSELEKADRERECLGFTGKVWLCPHLQLNYDQVMRCNAPPIRPQPHQSHPQSRPNDKQQATQLSSSQPNDTDHARSQQSSSTAILRYSHRSNQPPTTPPASPLTQECTHCTSIHVSTTKSHSTTTTTRTCFPLTLLPTQPPTPSSPLPNGAPPLYQPRTLPHPAAVAAALKKINAPICPHLKTSDACIGSAYEVGCLLLEGMGGDTDTDTDVSRPPAYCGCRACRGGQGRRGGGACGVCGARWGFDAKAGRGKQGREQAGKRFLRLVVEREVRSFGCNGVLDARWRKQLVQPDVVGGEGEGVEMRREWEGAVGVCRKLMHVDATGKHHKKCLGCIDKEILGP